MDSASSFSESLQMFPHAERLQVGGTTCECFLVKMYGKLHFLKRLKPELRTNPHYVAALQKEFETGYRLDHPHLVHYAAKTDDGILMDYVDGETLSQFVKHHPDYFRNRKNADRFLRQLLSVVGYLHEHQVVHLDLKPDNILITRIDHDVVLVDLGYCYTDSYIDTKGRTDKYAAPEQIGGSAKPDARTDIYAIGRILQTLPCADIYNKVIRRCTATNPSMRYQRVADIDVAISRRHPYWLVVAIIMVCIVLSIVFFWRNPFQKALAPSHQHNADKDSVNTVIPVQSSDIEDSSFQTSKLPIPQMTSSQRPVSPQPQPEAHSSKPEPSVPKPHSPKADLPAADTPSSSISYTAVDVAQVHRLLDDAIRPIYEQYMGSYRNADYYAMNQSEMKAYNRQHVAFGEACMRKYQELWQKNQQRFDKELFSNEFEKVREYYDSQTFLPSRKKQ